LSPQLLKRILRLRVTWMLLQEFEQDGPSLIRLALQAIDAREVQV
jgi:hypothetical protein